MRFAYVSFVYLLLAGGFRDVVANCTTKLPTTTATICLTKGCVLAAAAIIQNMDDTADPCEDFYQYACGGFVTRTNIPDDKSSITQISTLAEEVKQTIRDLLEKPKDNSEPTSFQKAKDMYAACMNTDRIESRGSKPLRDLLDRVGGWPVVSGSTWNEDGFNWVETTYKFREIGVSVDYILDINVWEDFRNTSHKAVVLFQPSFGMPDRDYLVAGTDDPLVESYYRLMVKTAVLLGASRTDAESQMKESLRFEIALANFSLTMEESRNITSLYHKMSVGDMGKLAPSVNWLEFLNNVVSKDIKDDDAIVILTPKYLQNALAHLSVTPKRTVANYLMWRLALDKLKHLSEDFRAIELEHKSQLTGESKETARWLQCMGTISTSMSAALSSVYVKEHVKVGVKSDALEMVSDIRDAFKEIMEKVDWMEPETKTKALEKLTVMTTHVAYPDELLDTRLVDEKYSSLSASADDHLANSLSVQKYDDDTQFATLRKPVDKNDWKEFSDVAEVNAYYNSLENSIRLPVGILQGVFFSNERPQYLNYGGIGFAVGHEFTHGFDDMGKQFNKDGMLIEWWDETTNKKFSQSVQCFIDQYGNFTVPENGMKVNGVNTQGENVADNGGVKEAYSAYQKWTVRNGVEPVLPGLQLTQQQLFWMSAANVWCGKERPELLSKLIKSDYHSPNRFRVNAPLANFPQFSLDFNCPAGSPMNPAHKCSVW